MELTSIQLVALMKAAVAPPTRRGEKPVSGSSAGLKDGSIDKVLLKESSLVDPQVLDIGVVAKPVANFGRGPLSGGIVSVPRI